MVIKLKRNGEYWTADIKDPPGSPVVGKGKTRVEALASLFRYTLALMILIKIQLILMMSRQFVPSVGEKKEYVADSVDPLSEDEYIVTSQCIHKYEE